MLPDVSFGYNKIANKFVFNDGLDVRLIKMCQKVLNFTYDIIDCHMDFGHKTNDNNWTGIIGQVFNNVSPIHCLQCTKYLNHRVPKVKITKK